ncbi:MAG: hypothetical protein KatS3mg027_0203 [Bacteroidia bacterium]|nr:MAG: hypothetical protein KatS3mg027_0203 [Bacteroidia bacterium]
MPDIQLFNKKIVKFGLPFYKVRYKWETIKKKQL